MPNSPKVTRGDAESVLHAGSTGGRAIVLHRGEVEGGPGDARPGSFAAIRPLARWDGRHFCADDWHVILLTLIDGGDSSYSHERAVESLSPTTMQFTLDGQPLATDRQSIRRFLNPAQFGFEEAYSYTQGKVMSPSELSAGQHTLSVQVFEGGAPFISNTITFHVDASGTGACVR